MIGKPDDPNPWPVAVAPQNDQSQEGIEDAVVEYNEFAKSYSQEVSLGGRRLIERRNFITNSSNAIVAKGNQHAGSLGDNWNGPYYIDDKMAPVPGRNPYPVKLSVSVD